MVDFTAARENPPGFGCCQRSSLGSGADLHGFLTFVRKHSKEQLFPYIGSVRSPSKAFWQRSSKKNILRTNLQIRSLSETIL